MYSSPCRLSEFQTLANAAHVLVGHDRQAGNEFRDFPLAAIKGDHPTGSLPDFKAERTLRRECSPLAGSGPLSPVGVLLRSHGLFWKTLWAILSLVLYHT